MRNLITLGVVFLATVSGVEAQSISVPSTIVTPGSSVVATVTGAPNTNYAVIGSVTNQGFSFAGTPLAVGPDVAILAVGVLGGTGTATVTLTPPFPGHSQYFVQLVTSTSASFVPVFPRESLALMSSDLARVVLPAGGVVHANGSTAQLSPGVVVTRDGVGIYRIAYTSLFATNIVPTFVPVGDRFIRSMTFGAVFATVEFDDDCDFYFTLTPVRR
jgi:hypothetical protein